MKEKRLCFCVFSEFPFYISNTNYCVTHWTYVYNRIINKIVRQIHQRTWKKITIRLRVAVCLISLYRVTECVKLLLDKLISGYSIAYKVQQNNISCAHSECIIYIHFARRKKENDTKSYIQAQLIRRICVFIAVLQRATC